MLALVAWGINILGYTIFPSQNLIPYFARLAITLFADLAIVYFSFKLLRLNGLPKKALGLSITMRTLTDLLVGIVIASVSLTLLASLLHLFVPFHFVPGPMTAATVLKEGTTYLLGNTFEELTFRGFLFIILAQRVGWRISMLIMALPFGFFHLPMIGLNTDGLKMVVTTAAYSFVFSLSFVLTRSMWTAISVHTASNILLHAVSGLDGAKRAMFIPEFERPWPTGYDAGLILFLASTLVISMILYLLILIRDKKESILQFGLP